MKNPICALVAIFCAAVFSGVPLQATAEEVDACYHVTTGKLRVETPRMPDCRPREEPISLNTSAPIGYVQTNTISLDLDPGELTMSGDITVDCEPGDYVTGCSFTQNSYSVALENIHLFFLAPNICGAGNICHGCQARVKNVSPTATETADVSIMAYCADVTP